MPVTWPRQQSGLLYLQQVLLRVTHPFCVYRLVSEKPRNRKLVCRCGRHAEAETRAKLHLNFVSQYILGKTVETLKLACCVRFKLKVFPVHSLPFSHMQMLLARKKWHFTSVCVCVYEINLSLIKYSKIFLFIFFWE